VLLCVTANHRTAEFDLLDRVSRGASSVAGDLVGGSDVVRGAVVLATCNRFEAYLEIDEPLTAAVEVATEVVFATLAASLGDDAERLRAAAAVHAGPAVARHLFAVTSGLESLVLGEDEIAGQVQRALSSAREAGTSSGGLERLFQRATRTSREVRAAADLGGAGRTVARLALDLASSRVADWAATTVLVVGTGSYAATTITALRSRGVTDLRVFSATARYEVTAADIPDDARRLIIDLGLPRNVRPDVGALPGVELMDLEVLALHAPLPELEPGARELVGSAADAFAAEELAAPAIVALRAHVFAALDAELARSRARGEDERTEQALRHFAGVLLHEPSVRARDFAAEGRSEEFAAALRVLYGVEAEVTPPSRRRDRPAVG
jgi:glutamyl-tRNA reductase